MKKILLLLTGLAIIFLGIQSTYAIPVEKDFEFNVTTINTNTTYPNLNVIGNTSTSNLYNELIDTLPLEIDGPVLSASMDILVTKAGVTYPGELSYYILTGSGFTNMYEISTVINGWPVRFEIWNGTYTYEGVTVLSNQVNILANDLLETSKLNSLKGIWEISATVEGTPDPGDGIDVSNNFNLLPSTIGNLNAATQANMVGYVYFEHVNSDLFDTYIIYAGTQYNLGQLQLPGVTELGKMPLNPGIYWTQNNKRNIYYEFQQPASETPINEQLNMFLSDPDQITGFRPFVTMNLTDSTYSFTHKLKLYAGYYGGPNAQAFADVVFPFELDELLSIEFSYRYRFENFWGISYTAWKDTKVTRYIDEPVTMINSWQAIKTAMNPLFIFDAFESVSSWVDYSINKITPTTQYKADYTTHINRVRTEQGKTQLSQAQIFPTGSDVYRVFLDNFYDSRYTGYEIHDDIIIMDVMYQVDGQIYHVGYTDIEQGGSFGGGGSGLGGQDKPEWNWNWLTSLFESWPIEYITIALIAILVVFWKPIKKGINNVKNLITNPRDLLLLGIIVALFLYYLGYL